MRLLVLTALVAFSAPAYAASLPTSAPITAIRYEITADSVNLGTRHLSVVMTFQASTARPIVLALPAWSPGHYTLLWFSRRVSEFAAASDGHPLEWRKLDFQTWEIRPKAPGMVTVSFRYLADVVDRAVAWTAPNFAFFNGTNLFLYPVGRGFDWPATVAVRTEPGWRVATGMKPSSVAQHVFGATNYHDLVDMPFYVGRFDIDSARVANHWVRFALYPAGAMTAARRDRTLDWLQKLLPVEAGVFGEIPFDSYTVFVRSDSVVNGGGLEHQNSQVDEVQSNFLDANLSGLYAHEMFHAWNVKRLRPTDLVPYRYDDAQPTPWLWVSEGVTDYYATLALSRSGIDTAAAYDRIAGSIVGSSAPSAAQVSLADASLSAWTGPLDGNDGLYYPKGALVGLLLDVLIRDASANRHSLDDVMRELYRTTYKQGRGFTSDDWWSAIGRAAGTRAPFAEFARRFVDGRQPLPIDSILALAALRFERRVINEPRLGVTMQEDSTGVGVTAVTPGGAADAVGVRVGDRVLSAGGVPTTKLDSFNTFRARYAGTTLTTLPLVIRRGTDTLTLATPVRLAPRQDVKVVPIADAPPKAIAIRDGLLKPRAP